MRKEKTFTELVYSAVQKIPKGETRTYKQIAKQIGRTLSYRAVGNALNKNRSKDVPCHRVVRSDGKTGGYAWGEEKKVQILKKEGAM